jgi:lipooligosaccharide transport system ATP-binding protein
LKGSVDGLVERVEWLPDRVLLYAETGDATLAGINDMGIQIETALVRRSSLEDVFLTLTGRTLIE